MAMPSVEVAESPNLLLYDRGEFSSRGWDRGAGGMGVV